MRGKNKKEKGSAEKYGVVKDATRGCRTIKKKKGREKERSKGKFRKPNSKTRERKNKVKSKSVRI